MTRSRRGQHRRCQARPARVKRARPLPPLTTSWLRHRPARAGPSRGATNRSARPAGAYLWCCVPSCGAPPVGRVPALRRHEHHEIRASLHLIRHRIRHLSPQSLANRTAPGYAIGALSGSRLANQPGGEEYRRASTPVQEVTPRRLDRERTVL